MVVFLNILDVSAYNTFVVWMKVNPGWNQGKFFKRRLFLEELGKAMVAPLIQRRQHLPQTPSSAGLVRDIQGPEARYTATRDRRDKRKRCKRDVKTSIMYHKSSAYTVFARHMQRPPGIVQHVHENTQNVTTIDWQIVNIWMFMLLLVILLLLLLFFNVFRHSFCNMVKFSCVVLGLCPFFTNKIIPVSFDREHNRCYFVPLFKHLKWFQNQCPC